MEIKLIIGNYELQPDNESVIIDRLEGINVPSVTRYIQETPVQDGGIDLGYKLLPRKISMRLITIQDEIKEALDTRETIARLLRPNDELIKLQITEQQKVRQIDCALDRAIEAPFDEFTPYEQRFALSFIASNPIFYDPNGKNVEFALGVSETGNSFIVPLSVPVDVGVSTLDQTHTVNYHGSWDTFPVIYITGSVTDLIITNLKTGDKLDFSGTTIPAGETWIIDCREYVKLVCRMSDELILTDRLTDDSDLATFRIVSDPDKNITANDFHVTGSNVVAGTKIVIKYNERFIGV